MIVQHYKGDIYRVVTEFAVSADTGEIQVVYVDAYGQHLTRKRESFWAKVDHEGKTVSRFTILSY